MAKIDMPLSYISEASKLNEILFDAGRTVTGNLTWTSSSSGITYNTATSTNVNIRNCGELGLANLLKATYGGNDGWLLMASDINSKSSDAHTHGNITTDGKIGSTPNKAVYTSTAGAMTAGTLPASAGGTGKASVTSGALLKGNGSNAMDELTGVGALYASTSGSPTFGTLPISAGGTGQTNIAAVRGALGLGNTTGALPVENGGTGVTSLVALREALGLGNSIGALPVTNGGTGVTSYAALRNAMGLGDTASALPIANGGTGASNQNDALAAILGNSAIPLANGGTGATTKANAQSNLGFTHGVAAPTGGSDGDIYFRYVV